MGISDWSSDVCSSDLLQEALEKRAALADLPLIWHVIGPLQSNKTRAIAENFDWVHSVDRIRIATRLGEQRPAQLMPLQVCVQVNISGERSEEHTSELQSLMRISYAVFCLKKKKRHNSRDRQSQSQHHSRTNVRQRK